MRCLAPLFLVTLLFAGGAHSGETSLRDAIEKARQRAGAPASNAKAKQEKAQREKAWRKSQEEKLSKAREEAARNAKEAEAARKTAPPAQPKAPTTPAKKIIRVFTLKDGTTINAVMAIELQDTYALKDAKGKLHEVKKDDVKSIEETEEPDKESE